MKSNALRPTFLLVSGLTLLLLAVAGCSNPASYKIPDTICGRDIDPSALKPLLPSGQHFEAVHETDDYESECAISVDKSEVLLIQEFRDQNKSDIRSTRMDNPKPSDVGEEAMTSDNWLISMNSCPRRGKYYFLDVIITANGVTEAKPKELEEFARTYLPEGLKKMGCTS
jgi:hypothetical protein